MKLQTFAAATSLLFLASNVDTTLGATSPTRIVDSHHHFFDFPEYNYSYLPEDYTADVVDPLAESNITLSGSVHVEFPPEVPFGGVAEAARVQSYVDAGRAPYLKAIVGSCDLGDAENVADCLSRIDEASPLMTGIRWILDYVGPFDSANKARSDIDYLRGGEGGTVVPEFETGYALLNDYGYSFDAHLAPVQLPAMAELASRYPDIPVVINHLGKPRLVLGPLSNATEPDEAVLTEWREGMKLAAAQPHVYAKLGMLGYAIPDWILNPKRQAVMKDLVLETVEMFGPRRCMFELNWYTDASTSDNDGLGTVGPSPVELTEYMSEWLSDYTDGDRDYIFAKTAEKFYNISYDTDVVGSMDVGGDKSGDPSAASSTAVTLGQGAVAMLLALASATSTFMFA